MKVSLIVTSDLYEAIRNRLTERERGEDRVSCFPENLSPVVFNFVLALKESGCEILHDCPDCHAAVVISPRFEPGRLMEYRSRGVPVAGFFHYTALLSYVCFCDFSRSEWDERKRVLEMTLGNCDYFLLAGYPQLGDFQLIFRDRDGLIDPGKIRFIHQYADETIFKPDCEAGREIRKKLRIEEDDIVFMYHGAFHSVVGLEHFADGFSRAANPKIRFLIIGEDRGQNTTPSCRVVSELRRLREYGKRDPRFIFVGYQPPAAVAGYLNAADVYVSHLSDHVKVQYFSRVGTFEAMGCGVPVVCSNTLGAHHFIRDGENGVILPPNSADAVTLFLEGFSREAAVRMKENMTRRVLANQWYFFRKNRPTVEHLFRRIAGGAKHQWRRRLKTFAARIRSLK